MLRADSPIQYVKGVGPARAARFEAIGVRTVADLLEYFPFRYESESVESLVENLHRGQNATVRGEIVRVRGGAGRARSCELHDGTGVCVLRWFNESFAGSRLAPGAVVVATGQVEEDYDGRPVMVHPTVEVFPAGTPILSAPRRAPRLLGVYRASAGLPTQVVRRTVLTVLEQSPLPVHDPLPAGLLRRHGLIGREAAIRDIHAPADQGACDRARRRLAYEEFLLMELALALRRRKSVTLEPGRKLHVTSEIDRRIRARFPFRLTPSQDAVVREIARDLRSGRPMTRLLQGDVGSGKTVVALYASLAAIANGRQAAIMCPTEVLAQQHFDRVRAYLDESRVRFALLRGGQSRRERTALLEGVRAGEIDLVVGTQALLERSVTFHDLAMVTVDEQHKFGVLQRAAFRTKGPVPHYLVMTATPIPRTLAMTVYGDLDVSIIRHSPPGRGRVITKVVARDQWGVVMEYVRRRLERGEQAFVVCPAIGRTEGEGEGEGADGPAGRPEADAAPRRPETRPSGRAGAAARPGGSASAARLASAVETHRALCEGPWRGLNVGLLHGGMRAPEKQAAMSAFASGQTHALVATTVVEVGVDIANATIMIVDHAERFGLCQLHQLRGRIGRGGKDGLCVLVAHDRTARALERLNVLTTTTDGFRIAEADLRQRGPGELLGTRQHGLPELRVGDLVNDFGLLERARRDAFEIVDRDPALRQPEHARLVPALRKLFGGKLSLIDAA